MARISTHVLDIERGKPAAGIGVRLYLRGALAGAGVTNVDGRTDEPLVHSEALETGDYELVFDNGAGVFFKEISIRFTVSDAQGNYHVPLLLAAHGYTTYRGS